MQQRTSVENTGFQLRSVLKRNWIFGRLAVSPPLEVDAERARRLLEAVPVSYVIVDNMPPPNVTRRYALPAMESDTINWRLSDTFEGTKLYVHCAGVNQRRY